METHQETSSAKDVFLRTVAVLGLIAVLLLGAWGIIQLAVSLPSIFGSVGNGVSSVFTAGSQKESLTVSAPSTIASGQSLNVSWTHQNATGDYAYTLSYACQNGLSLKAPVPTGSYQTVACNTPFNFVNAGGNMTLIPTAKQSTALALTVTATQLSTGAITTTGSATTQVAIAAASVASAQPTTYTAPATSYTAPSVSYQPAPTRAPLYGLPDLAVVYNSTIPSGSLTKITFTVENDGTNITPAGWTFNAQLPINGGYTFVSQPQQTLYPGDKIVYSLSFANNSYNTSYGNTYPYNSGYGYANGYQYANGYTGTSYYNGQGYYNGQSSYTGQSSYNCNSYGPCYNSVPTQTYAPTYTNQYPNTQYGYGSQGVVTITVDPQNYVQEYNKANNTLTIPVPVY